MEKVCIIKTINPLWEGWRGGAERKAEGSRQAFLWDGGLRGYGRRRPRVEMVFPPSSTQRVFPEMGVGVGGDRPSG